MVYNRGCVRGIVRYDIPSRLCVAFYTEDFDEYRNEKERKGRLND